MRSSFRALLSYLALSLLCGALPAGAQTLITAVPTGSKPVALALNSNTNKIFVVNQDSNNVTVIDAVTNGVAAVVAVGQSPAAVAVNPATNKAYIVNSGGNTGVTVIDGANYSTASIVTGAKTPLAAVVNPNTNRVYVANQNSNNVTVIDGSSNSIIATVAVGLHPQALAVIPAINKIYVADMSDGSVTVVDGASNSSTRIYTGGAYPDAIAVNALTKRVYVANLGGTVSVIDGVSNLVIANVTVGAYPCGVAINPVSNKIYVANCGDGTISVIKGTDNTATVVTVGGSPGPISVAAATNKVYVAKSDGTVVMIDGVSDSVAGNVRAGSNPDAVAVNPASNTIYVANQQSYTVTVIAGASSAPFQFIPLTPCRVADTRHPNGPFGGPPISGHTSRSFAIPASGCGVPATAAAYSLNVTVVPNGPLGYLTIWPTGQDQPVVSTLNSPDGRFKADAAIVPAGASGAVSVYVTDTTNVILDINGYFAPVGSSTLAFYPMTPCRLVDTRHPNGPFGGPFLQGGAKGRGFPLLSSSCNIPATAQAYSLNFTAVPHTHLDFLTTWPAGQPQPNVSTLNAPTGVATANAAIVPGGSNGDIDVYVSQDSDVVIDIDGYFAPAKAGGLSLYVAAPCRALDTRLTLGYPFNGQMYPPANIVAAPCGVARAAQAFVLNATVVPSGYLGFLALWPDGQSQPQVSTLNAWDGAITSNMAIVPTINGSIDAYASNPTYLLLDSSAYFGP